MLFRKLSIIALVAMAIGGFTALTASDANAQASATQSANINALINNPIVLAKTADMDFGSITPSTGATTVIIDPAGTVNGASTAIGLGGVPAAAGFTVSGLSNQAFTVTLPADGTIVLTGPGTDMAVDAFTTDAAASISAGGGPDAFGVGATLTVGANQTAGAYVGSFDVTVSYN
jgi:hypothetical protein